MVEEIQNESSIIWSFIWGIIKSPFVLVMVLIGKKEFSELFEPFIEFGKALVQPKFTTSMIVLNILVFIVSFLLPENIFLQLINYSTDMFSSRAYTLITSGFLHANLAHLGGNMLAIFIFGRVVEKHFGTLKTAIIYFSALIISGIFSGLIHHFILGMDIASVGASGAVMGLVSTAILLGPFTFIYEFILPIPVIVLGWITVLADITGILSAAYATDGIGHFAHLGGFLSIFLIMLFLGREDKDALNKGILINIVTFVVAVIGYYAYMFLL